MPMSEDFARRLYPKLPDIVEHFGTPFHIYDERGIRQFGKRLKQLFSPVDKLCGFQEFFAVKATPNLKILKIMKSMGFGFDCSSPVELVMARMVGAKPEDIMLTSNNTPASLYEKAKENGGCILNLDDISFVAKVPNPFPELICFRYNPGKRRGGGNTIIGSPEEAKYGVQHRQIINAYKLAINRGAKRFGLHTMIVSNKRDCIYMEDTVKMLLNLIEEINKAIGIKFEFINIGGGMGIPYHPDDKPFDFVAWAKKTETLLRMFKKRNGYAPKLYMESGRAMTGPHGVLVGTVINRMSKYREYVGVDICESALMRPAMYREYHHITVISSRGKLKTGWIEKVDVVSSLCENFKLADQRLLPKTREGDFVVIHDNITMGSQHNGWLKPKAFLLREDGDVKMIRRAETAEDYLRTMDFKTGAPICHFF